MGPKLLRCASVPLAAALLLPLAASASAPADSLGSADAELAASHLLLDQAVHVTGVHLQIDLGELTLDDGVLVPASPVAGRPVELVFLGTGRLEVEPPDDIERDQLELFTGEERFDQAFERAVLVVAPDAAVDALWSRRPRTPLDAAQTAAAGELFTAWRASIERRQAKVDLAIAEDALGDPGYAGYFLVWLRGSERGDVVYVSDPEAWEQVTLGRFVPIEADEREKRVIAKQLGRQQRKGRALGIDVDDLGNWDQWLSSARRRADGSPAHGFAAIEPESYTIDLRLADERDLPLTGDATVTFVESTPGRTAARFTLNSDLELTAVRDAAGAEVPFLRRDSAIVVPLSPPLAEGERRTLTFRYRGKLLDKAGRSWGLADTLGWYPHAGDVDRARYDLTFHWPRRLELLASGVRVDGGSEGSTGAWEHRRLDTPSIGVSFEVGRFRMFETTAETTAGKVRIHVAFDPKVRELSGEVEKEVVETAAKALDYYSRTFGPYPLDELTIVTVPRTFSQGLLGFVTLSSLQLWDFGIFAEIFEIEDRRTIVAHELAHQWWGNQVGFSSYRDAWTSEALASYSALVFARNELDWTDRPRIGPTAGWQRSLNARTASGWVVDSLGPVVLGPRLISSQSSSAYADIVYRKGAIVFDMLAKMYGEENFLRILAEVVRTASGFELTTEDFLAAVERTTGTDLEPFADLYVYGTGVPEIGYRYSVQPNGAKWHVAGTIRMDSPLRYHYGIRVTDSGRLDCSRTKARGIGEARLEKLTLAVPFQVKAAPPAGESRAERKQKGEDRWIEGRMALHGTSTDFGFDVPQEPKRLYLDLAREVYASFFDESREPKRMRLRVARETAARGELDAAEREFRAVFTEPVLAPGAEDNGTWSASRLRADERYLDAWAHLGLARLCLDRDDSGCKAEIEAADRTASSREQAWIDDEVETLRARADLARGDSAGVLKRLRKSVLKKSDLDRTEAWVLLAIAAREEHDGETLVTARKELEERRVDLSPLDEDAGG